MPGVLNPVSYHPLLTRASLDHQAEAKVGILGHFNLQTPSGVPAYDWAILQQKTQEYDQTRAITASLELTLNAYCYSTKHKVISSHSIHLCKVPKPLGHP